MVLVKVYRISSMNDPETGRPGKVIELVEVKRRDATYSGVTEDVFMVQRILQSVFMQMQSMGLIPSFREAAFPKIILFLTEEEYEMLNIKLEVNDVYDVQFKDGKITFTPA